MKKKILYTSIVISFCIPIFAHAQNIFSLVGGVGLLIRFTTPIVVGLALLGFFWGLVRFIWGGGENREQGKNIMIWGIIALFVMISVWGIVRFIQGSLGIDQGPTTDVPFIR